MSGPPVLLLTGSVGVGKTTVAEAIHDLLSGWEVPHACVDRDALTWSWPPDGPFNEAVARRNLASLWDNFYAAGARCLVVAGVIESRADREAYAGLIPGAQVTVCRLVASVATREERLQRRERGESLAWHLARTRDLDRILDAAGVTDVVVENDGRDPEAVAREVLQAVGWDQAAGGRLGKG